MIGVQVSYRHMKAEVLRYEPLGSGLCDTLVQEVASGRKVWVASHELKRLDGVKITSRQEHRAKADEEALSSLREIRRQHVGDFLEPWPGLEHGKALLGQMLDTAIGDIEKRRPLL
jgi:hypothetical protein